MHVTVTRTLSVVLPLTTVTLKHVPRPLYWSIIFLALVGFVALPSATMAAKHHAPGQATSNKIWTESRLERAELLATKAYERRKWAKAIRHGEKALRGCLALFPETSARCILIMKNNSLAYYRAGSILKNASEIERAYKLASAELGFEHFSTTKTREVYHQLLLEQERYTEAIAVVRDLITAEQQTTKDEFKELDLLIQLYALYKVEGHTEHELPTLQRMAKLTEKLLGSESEQLTRTHKVLAETYCTQKLYHEFYELVRQHDLGLSCK